MTGETVRKALNCQEHEFATCAVHAVLRRVPTIQQLLEIHEQRAQGVSRAAIIRSLLRIAANENQPSPDDWALALPRRIDVSPLIGAALSTPEFIARAYQTILRRTPSQEEIAQQRSFLRWSRTRSDFVVALALSAEAEAVGGEITLFGLGRRAPSWRRFVADFSKRGSVAPSETYPGNRPRETGDHGQLLHVMNALAEQLSSIRHQISAVESIATSIHALSTTMQRIRTRLETEGAKTSEIAADSKVMQELLRETANRVTDISRAAALLADSSRTSDEALKISRTLENTPAVLQYLTNASAGFARGIDGIDRAVGRIDTTGTRIEDAISGLGNAIGRIDTTGTRIEVAVSDLGSAVSHIDTTGTHIELGLVQLGSRVRPPVMPAGDTVVTQVDGFFLGVPTREWRLSTYYHNRGPLEPGVYALLQKVIRPGMIVADVGASVGLYSLLSARILQGKGRVFSFEPTPAIFRLLTENLRLNGFTSDGVVRLYECALSDRTGVVSLYTDGVDSTHNSLFPEPVQTEAIEVRAVALDDVLGLEMPLDVVKIDAEGSEPLVIRGMNRLIRGNPGIKIVMEFAPGHIQRSGINPIDFLDEVRTLGLTSTAIDDLTGELAPIDTSLLLARENTNLMVTRP